MAAATVAHTIAPWLTTQVNKCLPPVAWAMAYGSGVFQQKGYEKNANTMVDMVLAVDDAVDWHTKNIEMNPSHYSAMRYLGANAVANLQDKCGAGIYFNTMVPMGGRIVKYGVITVEHLVNDLNHWDTLYTAGRLQKPVSTLIDRDDRLFRAMEVNRAHAVNTSLLLLPQLFTPSDLFLAIAHLSYAGDVRMGLAENPAKVRNIVHGSYAGFVEIYADIMESHPQVKLTGNGKYEQDMSEPSRLALLKNLPRGVICRLPSFGPTEEETLYQISRLPPHDVSRVINKSVSKLVLRSSAAQSLKGLATAGLQKSTVYLFSKIRKRFS